VCSSASTSRDLLLIAAVAIGVVGCKGAGSMSDRPPVAGAGSSAVSGSSSIASNDATSPTAILAVPPATRAQKVLDAQIAAFKSHSDADLRKAFDSAAVILVHSGHELDEEELASTLIQVGPHERVLEIRVRQLVAGGNDDAVWLMAELAITKQDDEPQDKPQTNTETIRATQLIAASADWKVVTAAFSEPREPGRRGGVFPMHAVTAAGPLSPMLAATAKLAHALGADPSVVVVPPDKPAAVGPRDTRALLATFAGRNLAINGATREVRTDNWGSRRPTCRGSSPAAIHSVSRLS